MIPYLPSSLPLILCIGTCSYMLKFPSLFLFVQGRSTQSSQVFAAGTKILNIEDMHFKDTFKLGGGTGLRFNNVLKQSGLVTVLQDLV